MQRSKTCKPLYLLLPLLSICVWTIGCGQPADTNDMGTNSETTPSSGNGDEAGSQTPPSGTDVPGESDAAGESTEDAETEANTQGGDAPTETEGGEGGEKKEGE